MTILKALIILKYTLQMSSDYVSRSRWEIIPHFLPRHYFCFYFVGCCCLFVKALIYVIVDLLFFSLLTVFVSWLIS